MVIANRFLHRFGQIMIRFNHNKTAKLTSSRSWKYLNYIRSYTISKLNKKEKKSQICQFLSKKSISCIITCSFKIFRLIFTNLDFFLKVGFELKLRSQSYHVGSISYRFGDIQNWPIFKKKLTLTHRLYAQALV